ncbi:MULTISPECIES: multiheme c-type cytochrome [Shewanella]|uniref:multiheme c-type cytochrome n=1 Tax=Shewanella TaxID=22 RepID=UPI000E75E1DB|nr:cytochrome c3 family protein [Shewanella japonica]
MKHLTKRKLAFVIAAAMGIAGCGSDGKDGEDGVTPPPPSAETSEITNVDVIHHEIGDGKVTFEFQITNEKDMLIVGLEKANAELAAMTDKGIARSRDDFEGTIVGGSASESTAGASLTVLENGNYEFVAPMPNVTAGTEGIVRLAVGGGDLIAKSRYIVVSKPENVHTTTTETCQSCHVDFHASDVKHSSYTAIDTEGETDLVAGCLVCHNNVVRDDGGYARNSMQKLGHINHNGFEKDFTATNCYTCHAEPVINTSIAGNGCSDCHTTDMSDNMALLAANSDFDAREFHVKSEKIGITERQTIREEHSTTLSAVYMNDLGEYCTDLTLFKGEEVLDIEALYNDGTLSYASTYLHGYHNESLVGRESRNYEESYKGDGTKTFCHPELDLNTPQIMASARVTFKGGNWIDDDGKYGVSLTSYSPVADLADLNNVTDYDRRHAVTTDSCTTCHNNETNYHKNGSYAEGGLDCVACHNNGQDRSAGNSAPGFGPMVHSMHWGVGSQAGEDGENAAARNLDAANCVSCHADGIELYAIPNQYMLSKAYNGGDSGVMTSPITANCYACHNGEQALNHMEQNGGELNVEAGTNWYTNGTSESCATCHDAGKSMGIDKFHNFER